jgi:hypothetical protein
MGLRLAAFSAVGVTEALAYCSGRPARACRRAVATGLCLARRRAQIAGARSQAASTVELAKRLLRSWAVVCAYLNRPDEEDRYRRLFGPSPVAQLARPEPDELPAAECDDVCAAVEVLFANLQANSDRSHDSDSDDDIDSDGRSRAGDQLSPDLIAMIEAETVRFSAIARFDVANVVHKGKLLDENMAGALRGGAPTVQSSLANADPDATRCLDFSGGYLGDLLPLVTAVRKFTNVVKVDVSMNRIEASAAQFQLLKQLAQELASRGGALVIYGNPIASSDASASWSAFAVEGATRADPRARHPFFSVIWIMRQWLDAKTWLLLLDNDARKAGDKVYAAHKAFFQKSS